MAYDHTNTLPDTGIMHYLTEAQSLIYLYMLIRADRQTGRLWVTAKILAKTLGLKDDTARQALSMLARMDIIRTEIAYNRETGRSRVVVQVTDAEHVESVIDFLNPHYARAQAALQATADAKTKARREKEGQEAKPVKPGPLNILRIQKDLFAEGAKSPTSARVLSNEQMALIEEPIGFLDEVAAQAVFGPGRGGDQWIVIHTPNGS